MSQYKVRSSLVSGFALGDVVTDSDLPGVNVDALIEAGHLGVIGKVSTLKAVDKDKD